MEEMNQDVGIQCLSEFAGDLVARSPSIQNGMTVHLMASRYDGEFCQEMFDEWADALIDALDGAYTPDATLYIQDDDGTIIFFILPDEFAEDFGELILTIHLSDDTRHLN